MADDEDLKLNTLHRFAKQSRLVLHEYSHCEVPAGCGGVILRWIDPAQGRPANVRIQNARGRVWLDGVELGSSMTLLAGGAHVLAIEIEAASVAPWTVSIEYDETNSADLISRGSARWIGHEAPAGEWFGQRYRDDAWPPLVPASRAAIEALDKWPRRSLEDAIGAGLVVFEAARRFVRVHFLVEARS